MFMAKWLRAAYSEEITQQQALEAEFQRVSQHLNNSYINNITNLLTLETIEGSGFAGTILGWTYRARTLAGSFQALEAA